MASSSASVYGLAETFPQLGPVRLDYCWGGLVDMTQDRLPHAGDLPDLVLRTGLKIADEARQIPREEKPVSPRHVLTEGHEMNFVVNKFERAIRTEQGRAVARAELG